MNLRLHLRSFAFVLPMILSLAPHAHAQNRRTHGVLSPNTPPVDLSSWPADGLATGLQVQRVYGPEAGLPLAQFPGVRLVSMQEVQSIDVSQVKTGLFLVDTDFVPSDLSEILKRQQYTLRDDGTLLDSNNEPLVAFVTSELYAAALGDNPNGIDPNSGDPNGGVRHGLLQRTLNRVGRIGNRIANFLVPEARAATPFRWACFSFSPWAVYHSGFHRWYEASTWTGSYGADSRGGCSGASPRTRIDFQRARAAVASAGSTRSCYACDASYAYDTWDVGYFWPAHGIPTTYHSGLWADGTFSFTRAASLTW